MLTIKPYKFQKEGVVLVEDLFNGRALIADQMGLGKTIQALWFLYRNKNIEKAVVVTFASLKRHWRREAINSFGIRAEILESQTPYKVDKKKRLYIINYDVLQYWVKYLKRRIDPGLIILDECQAIGNDETLRSKACIELCQECEYVLGLSGTPFNNNPIELFPFLSICRPDVFDSKYTFGSQFCNPTRSKGKWVYKGAKNLPELHQLLTTNCMIRRQKKDVLKDLPSKTRHVMPIDIDMAEYRFAERDFRSWLKKYKPEKAIASDRVLAFTKMNYLLGLVGRLKVKGEIEWTEQYLKEQNKFILFGHHRDVIGQMEDYFKDICLKIDGSTPADKRQDMVDRFNDGKDIRLLIGNIKAMGTGLNMRGTSDEGFLEYVWTPSSLIQAEDRVNGINRGNGNPNDYYYFVAEDTVEQDLLEIVQKKQKMQDAALDGGKVEDEWSVFDLMVEKLQEKWF